MFFNLFASGKTKGVEEKRVTLMHTLKDVVTNYNKWYKQNYHESLKRYGDFLNAAAYCDEVMAEVLLIGNHQARLNDLKSWRADAKSAIVVLAKARPWKKSYADFGKIYEDVKKLIGDINNIGPLTIYDVALRLAAQFNNPKMMPQKVYLNAGPWKAAKIMRQEGVITTLSHVMAKADFPDEFKDLRCDEIEDMLCSLGHYGVFSDLDNIGKALPMIEKRTKSGNLFRKNLLAHKLLEVNLGKDPIHCNQLTKLSDRL